MNIREELAKRNLRICDLVRGLELDRTTVEKWLRGVTPIKRVHELAVRMWLLEQDKLVAKESIE